MQDAFGVEINKGMSNTAYMALLRASKITDQAPEAQRQARYATNRISLKHLNSGARRELKATGKVTPIPKGPNAYAKTKAAVRRDGAVPMRSRKKGV